MECSFCPLSWGLPLIKSIMFRLFPKPLLMIQFTCIFPKAGIMTLSQVIYSKRADPAFCDKSHFIKLKHILYGCKQTAHNWYMHLVKGLLAWGFHQLTVDHCLFLSSDCIIVLYTDDCCIFRLNDDAINSLLASLSEEFILQDEGSIKNYLGINITKVHNPSTGEFKINFKQMGLINSILSNLKLISTDTSSEPCNPANPQTTPMANVLHPNPDADLYDPWDVSYHSIIGKLNIPMQHTWPDIVYAVNSCAHFVNAPNKSHFTTMKWIGHYLLGSHMGQGPHPSSD